MSIPSFPFGDGRLSPHMTAATWQQRLDVARTPQDVVDIARDFVATFTPYELHALPEKCRPSTKLFLEDMAHLAFELVQHGCTPAGAAATVQRLAGFFGYAATRLAQLATYEREVPRTADSHSGVV